MAENDEYGIGAPYAHGVRLLYDCSKLPEGYDYTDAVAVAHAGEAKRFWESQEA